jgi:NTE family protein
MNQGNETTARKPVKLALQGGGSWGAYTWGVLDALLASRTVSIEALSGTSAGALNAAIVTSALATGTPAQARERLRAFWEAIAQPALADVGREMWGPVERKWRETVDLWLGSGALSPSIVDPLGVNPLREIIAAHVDIDAVRSAAAMPLYVTVTNVRTGLPRVIGNDAMTLDVLLASACLPQLFQAVEIDGEPYWDGGYSGNPTLWPVIESGGTDDVIVVQLTPGAAAEVPRDSGAIRRRINQIVFNASLVAEMQSIAGMRAVAADDERGAQLRALRLHRIGPPAHDVLEAGSPLERSRAWIERLHVDGRGAARRFLTRHAGDIGVRETLDIARVFAASRTPGVGAAANEAAFARAETA